tara:strand:- start:75 stop:494 length:420 start_codon:yes stop_codon:yes gene_type:complete
MDINKQKSDIGVLAVMNYLKKERYTDIMDVTKLGGEHKGHDLIAKKENKKIKIEVKCSIKEEGIPDCFPTEFNNDLTLVPDYLYIVRINENHNPIKIETISKKEFDKYSKLHRKVERIRISSKLKKDLKKGNIGKVVQL